MKFVIKDLCKKIKNELILNNVNVEFNSSNIYGIIGGGEKRIFLKLLCSFCSPDSGYILQDDYNYTKSKEFPKNTRIYLGGENFFEELTGYENLKRISQIENKITDKDIDLALKDVFLYDSKNVKYKKYLMDRRNKLGIAAVLMEKPKCIILDEPFNSMEREDVEQIKNVLTKLKEDDCLVIVASYVKEEIYDFCDKIFEFNNGKLIEKE